MTTVDELHDDQESRFAAFSRHELARLQKVREQFGDEQWARSVGDSVITQLTLIIQGKAWTEHRYLALQGEYTLKLLSPLLLEIYTDPTLGVGMATGIIEELATRKFIDLDIEELLALRKNR